MSGNCSCQPDTRDFHGREIGLHGAALEEIADRLDQLLGDEPAVADDRHVGPAHLALLGRVDVDVDDLGVGGEGVDAAGDAVVEAGAEGDQQVALLHRRGGGGGAVHAGHAEVERVVVGEHATRHQRGDDVDPGEVDQLAQRLGGARLEHAAADVEHRPLGLEDQLGRLLDHPRVTLGGRAVAGQRVGDLFVGRPVPRHLVLQHVLRDVDQRRPGAARGGDVERLTDRHRDVVGASSPTRCAWCTSG